MMCPVCGAAPKTACACPQHHQSCEAGHHWHRRVETGLTVIDRTGPGECVVSRPPADPGRFVRAVLHDAAGRVVDSVLADLLIPPETAATVREALIPNVVRVLRGLRPRRPRPSPQPE
jgi:hypothetical protein